MKRQATNGSGYSVQRGSDKFSKRPTGAGIHLQRGSDMFDKRPTEADIRFSAAKISSTSDQQEREFGSVRQRQVRQATNGSGNSVQRGSDVFGKRPTGAGIRFSAAAISSTSDQQEREFAFSATAMCSTSDQREREFGSARQR